MINGQKMMTVSEIERERAEMLERLLVWLKTNFHFISWKVKFKTDTVDITGRARVVHPVSDVFEELDIHVMVQSRYLESEEREVILSGIRGSIASELANLAF